VAGREHERCEACGFDGAALDGPALLDALRGLGPRWDTLLATAGLALRIRPTPGVWSAIEYAGHSCDIMALHVFGVEQALTVDEPAFPAIDEDLAGMAIATYADLDPRVVATELTTQATELADLVDEATAFDPDAWARGLTIGDERSDVRFLLEHALHDSVHHLDDVERGFAVLRRPAP
jgi:hypothetical protein